MVQCSCVASINNARTIAKRSPARQSVARPIAVAHWHSAGDSADSRSARRARTASRTLIPGGLALFVTKTPGWYTERLPKWFSHVEPRQGKNYTIVAATK